MAVPPATGAKRRLGVSSDAVEARRPKRSSAGRRRLALLASALAAAVGQLQVAFSTGGATADRGTAKRPRAWYRDLQAATPAQAASAPAEGPALLSGAAALAMAFSVGTLPAGAAERSIFDRLFNLREEEDGIKRAEVLLQKEIEEKRSAGDVAAVGRLLTEDGIMKQEISILQREEKDIDNPKKFKEDVRELTELQNIETRLQWTNEENKELDFLETLINKFKLQ